MATLKVYVTTIASPPGDIRSLIGESERHGHGMFDTYVVATSETEAVDCIRDAYSGSHVEEGDLLPAQGEAFVPLFKTGVFGESGSVVTSHTRRRNTNVVVTTPEGDPRVLGHWMTVSHEGDLYVNRALKVNGEIFEEDSDPAYVAALRSGREADQVKEGVIARVEGFLNRFVAVEGPENDLIDDYDTGETLNASDLRAVIELAKKG